MTRPQGLRGAQGLTATVLLALAAPAAAVPDTLGQRAIACLACHQPGDHKTPDGYVPRIAGKPAGYLAEQMRNFRDRRRTHEGMARLFENLDDRYLAELAAWFADQPPSRRALSSPPLDVAAAQRAEAWVRRGDAARKVPACTACHGSALTGVAPSVPGLLGLSATYVSAQLGAWRQGLRKARAPDCMAHIAQALPEADIPALARWLEAQPLAADARPAAAASAPWPLECGSVAR